MGGVKSRVLFLLSRYPVGYFVYAQHNRALSVLVAVVDFVVMVVALVCSSIILPFSNQLTHPAPFPPPSPPPHHTTSTTAAGRLREASYNGAATGFCCWGEGRMTRTRRAQQGGC